MAEEAKPKEVEEEQRMEEEKSEDEGPEGEEPQPIEAGDGAMQKRAEELKKQMLEARAVREKSLEEALAAEEANEDKKKKPEASQPSQPPAEGESSESEKEKDEDTVSSATDSSEEEADEDKKKPGASHPSQLSKLPEVALDVSAEPEKGDVEDPDDRRAAFVQEFNSSFIERVKGEVKLVELNIHNSVSKTITTMYHGCLSVIQELHEASLCEIQDMQSLGVINDETLVTLTKALARNKRMKELLESKDAELEKEMADLIDKNSRKRAWIQKRLSEITAEQGTLRKSEQAHLHVEKFVEAAMKAFRAADWMDG